MCEIAIQMNGNHNIKMTRLLEYLAYLDYTSTNTFLLHYSIFNYMRFPFYTDRISRFYLY